MKTIQENTKKRNLRKTVQWLGTALCLLSAPFFLSCSDWDDHYEANSQVTATQTATLWENIEANGQLSEFASLLRQTGYDEVLNATQTYTVWAPLNGTFDYDNLSAIGHEKLLKEFVLNHISRNNYPATGTIANERIFMLNEKLMHFEGTPAYGWSGYRIQDVALSQPNLGSSNGILHTLNGKIPFLPNIYESLNNEQFAIDSVSDFFHSHDVNRLDEEKSVKGPTLNGEQTYLDSIYTDDNNLYNLLRSYINREDSNYTMLVPTNEAWSKAREQASRYFTYIPSFDFAEDVNTTTKKVTTVTLKDMDYLRDSMINVMLMRDMFYNNNLYDNKHLNTLQDGEILACDSLVSTSRSIVYSEDAASLFEGAHRVDKSNGAIWITDSLRMRPWTTWNPEIKIEAESSTYFCGSNNVYGEPSKVRVLASNQNPEVPGSISNGYYLEAEPSSLSAHPEVDFYLPNVRSTTYSAYVVMVPANITNARREAKPYRLRVTLGSVNQRGRNTETRLRNPADNTSYYSTDASKVDTVYLGDIDFPMAFVGTGEYYPYLRIESYVTTSYTATHDKTLRVDCIILRPKELDDHLKAHPDYHYDNGNY